MVFLPKILSTQTSFARYGAGNVEYFKAPLYREEELIEDINQIPYLQPIVNQVIPLGQRYILKTKLEDQGMMTALYLSGLYASQLGGEYWNNEDWEAEGVDILYEEDTFIVISAEEIMNSWNQGHSESMSGMYQINTKSKESHIAPLWEDGDHPLVIKVNNHNSTLRLKDAIATMSSPIILIIYQEGLDDYGWGANHECGQMINQLVFEEDYKVLEVGECTAEYEQSILTTYVVAKEYTLGQDVCLSKIIKDLKAYRQDYYKEEDLRKLVRKAIDRAQERGDYETLIGKDFRLKDYSKEEAKEENTVVSKENEGREALEELIGLEAVKRQLNEIVARLKLEQLRRDKGYKRAPIYMNMTFLGNPGVAKTTVARLFSNWLIEEELVSRKVFREVARKDLVGQYTGWTAKAVADIFAEVKGGVLFIDEAYALTDRESMRDGFSGEAIAEIIRQMENNKDTIVIFAGYKGKKMDDFMSANPGIRSRISFEVEFEDYTVEELWKIVGYHAKQTGFELESGMKKLVRPFFEKIIAENEADFGNGRMARKLLETATTFMATRIYQEKSEDLVCITKKDMQSAMNSLSKQSGYNKTSAREKIGFRM